MKAEVMYNNNDEVGEVASQMFKAAEQITQQACLKLRGHPKAAAIAAVLNFGAGYMQTLSALIARHDTSDMENFNPNFAVTPDVMLFAALLSNQAAPLCTEKGEVDVEFGPHIIWKTLKMFEQYTGRPADGSLQQSFVEVGRKFDPKMLPFIEAGNKPPGTRLN